VRGVRSVEGRKWLLIYCWMGRGRCLKMLGKDELKGNSVSAGRRHLTDSMHNLGCFYDW
jgi:hypothetical protein